MTRRTTKYSGAFREYIDNMREIGLLLRTVPSLNEQLSSRKKTALANALYRGIVVLLSSHLERYCEALVVEAVDILNASKLNRNQLPSRLQLLQILEPLQLAYEINGVKDVQKKADALKFFSSNYMWFWDETVTCNKISGEVIVRSFSNPLPERIDELFDHFNVIKITHHCALRDTIPQERGLIPMKVKELIDKRNAIAHTGMTTDLGIENVRAYLRCTCKLVRYMDQHLGNELNNIINFWPWSNF